ncbi:MAG: hypothetical protein AAF950_18615 [Pseudomonadota bacterium]
MADDPEKDTLQSMFRLLREVKTEMVGLREDVAGLRGELRAAKKDLGEEIDGLAARLTADKASVDGQLGGLRQDLNVLRDDFSRHATSTKSIQDSHTARFRTLGERLDKLADQNKEGMKAIIDRLDRAFVPAE